MAMVCVQCNHVYHGKERSCSKCGIPLLRQQHGILQPDDTMPPQSDALSRWQQTPWGRIVVSVLIAQGVAFCLQLLMSAWHQAADGEKFEWHSTSGMIWLNAFHCFSLIFCGMLAGANQERGTTSGGLVGLWSGLIFIAVHHASRESLHPAFFFAQPFVQMVFGLIGGAIGHRIWKPVPLFHVEDDMGKSGFAIPRPNKKLWKGPIHVVRVLLGAGLCLAGAIFAHDVIDAILRNSGGLFRIRDNFTQQLLIYQVIGLAALAGGSLAGSSSRNGFKQGVCAALICATLYFGVQLANPKAMFESALFTSLGVAGLTIVGGMFGSTLFPPLVKQQPKSAIPY